MRPNGGMRGSDLCPAKKYRSKFLKYTASGYGYEGSRMQATSIVALLYRRRRGCWAILHIILRVSPLANANQHLHADSYDQYFPFTYRQQGACRIIVM